MKYGFIYETTNLVNGMKYIGKHKRSQNPKDPDDSYYLGSGKVLDLAIQKSIREFGDDWRSKFSRRILCECDSEESLEERERYYIDYYNAVESPEYYNLCKDANPPVQYGPQSESKRSHISESLRGNLNCLGKQNTLGKHWILSEETKKKQSIALRGNTHKLGMKDSAETCEKKSIAARSRVYTKTCVICGGTFFSRGQGAKYCDTCKSR